MELSLRESSPRSPRNTTDSPDALVTVHALDVLSPGGLPTAKEPLTD